MDLVGWRLLNRPSAHFHGVARYHGPMPIVLRCTCGRECTFRDDMAGQSGRCYSCGAEIAIPAPSAPTGPATAPCPACGGVNRIDARECKWCRKALGASPPPPPPVPAAQASVSEAVRRVTELGRHCGVAWEDGDGNFLSTWWRTWWGAQLGGEAYWRRMPWSGGFGKPLRFALMLPAQVLILAAVLGAPVVFFDLADIRDRALQGFGLGLGCLFGIATAVGAFAGTAIGTFFWAGVTHLAAMALGGRGSFEATYRCTSYLFGSYVWILIPYAGFIIQPALHLTGLSAALARAHDMPRWRGVVAGTPSVLPVVGLWVFLLVALTLG